MILLDDSLFNLYREGTISFDNMMTFSKDVGYLSRKVQEAGLMPK